MIAGLRDHRLPLAASTCALVALLLALRPHAPVERTTVVVAQARVKAGNAIPASALGTVEIAAADRAPGMIAATATAAGQRAAIALAPGEYVTRSMLGETGVRDQLGPGERAVTIVVEPSALPSTTILARGSLADVAVTFDADADVPAHAAVVASGIEVLERRPTEGGSVAVTLRLHAREVRAVLTAEGGQRPMYLLARPGRARS